MKEKNNTRAIIVAAGEATRWKNHLGTNKHLIIIEEEPLLHRTIRLLRERGIVDIFVVSKDDPRYKIKKTKQYIAKLDYENNADADKFLSSRELWNEKDRTILIYGDCYFTDDAMDKIVNYKGEKWMLFCRPDASKITGTKWGECFAISFLPHQNIECEEKLHYIAELKKTDVITRCGGWELYRAMTGRVGEKVRRPHTMIETDTAGYIVIDDWTDDFDYPEDYDTWSAKRMEARLKRKL